MLGETDAWKAGWAFQKHTWRTPRLWGTPGSLFMCPPVRRVSEPQLCLWALQTVLLVSQVSPLLCWVPRPVRSGLDRKNQGEHRRLPNGELDDPSLLFSLGDITSKISKYWVSLFIRILFALATQLCWLHSNSAIKPSQTCPPPLSSRFTPNATLNEWSLLWFTSKVLLKLPYFPKPHPLWGALKCKYFISSQYETNQSDIMCCILTLSFARRL